LGNCNYSDWKSICNLLRPGLSGMVMKT